VYEGQWKDGVREGYGKLRTKSGYKYKGLWKNNKQDGRGIEK